MPRTHRHCRSCGRPLSPGRKRCRCGGKGVRNLLASIDANPVLQKRKRLLDLARELAIARLPIDQPGPARQLRTLIPAGKKIHERHETHETSD